MHLGVSRALVVMVVMLATLLLNATASSADEVFREYGILLAVLCVVGAGAMAWLDEIAAARRKTLP